MLEENVFRDTCSGDAVKVFLQCRGYNAFLCNEFRGSCDISVTLDRDVFPGDDFDVFFHLFEVDRVVSGRFVFRDGSALHEMVELHHVRFAMCAGSTETYGTEDTGDKGHVIIHEVFVFKNTPFR